MQRTSWRFILGALATAVSLVLAVACQGGNAGTPEYMPTATIKDIMQSIIDESADVVWLAVTTVQNEQGVTETRPQNDEEWHKVRLGAMLLAEASNLLLMPGRRVARPGELSEAPGVELEPEEMDALIAADRDGWNQHARALHNAALEALQAIDAKDADKLFAVGEQIELACEGCHTQYWYPNEEIPTIPESPR
jgi:hypothetical protein